MAPASLRDALSRLQGPGGPAGQPPSTSKAASHSHPPPAAHQGKRRALRERAAAAARHPVTAAAMAAAAAYAAALAGVAVFQRSRRSFLRRLLLDLGPALDSLGQAYWVDFGGLLGLTR